MTAATPRLARLEPLVGRWRMAVGADPVGETEFAWMSGGRFLVQRWSTPQAAGPPTGLAVIGEDPAGAAFVQHYFDSRGVARVYAMDVAGGVWTLSRPAAGPGSDFAQRFEGFLVDRDSRIDGRWHREDGGRWHVDFALRYERIG